MGEATPSYPGSKAPIAAIWLHSLTGKSGRLISGRTMFESWWSYHVSVAEWLSGGLQNHIMQVRILSGTFGNVTRIGKGLDC